MPKTQDQTFFQRIYEMGEERLNVLAEELLANPKFAEILGSTLQKAMDTKGRVDRNMQTILGLLNVPSKADYRKLATKIEALQGSLVNLNIKLDRILAAQQQGSPAGGAPKRRRPRTSKPHRGDETGSTSAHS